SDNPPSLLDLYTLSLHDALPISVPSTNGLTKSFEPASRVRRLFGQRTRSCDQSWLRCFCWLLMLLRRVSFFRPRSFPIPTKTSPDRKSTRLNSSHVAISYAVFCL